MAGTGSRWEVCCSTDAGRVRQAGSNTGGRIRYRGKPKQSRSSSRISNRRAADRLEGGGGSEVRQAKGQGRRRTAGSMVSQGHRKQEPIR